MSKLQRGEVVAQVRAVLGTRTNAGIPNIPMFSANGKSLYFVGYRPTERSPKLYRLLLTAPEGSTLEWEDVVGSEVFGSATSELSVKEQLYRERLRLGTLGLSLCRHDQRSGRFLVPGGGKLYVISEADDPAQMIPVPLHLDPTKDVAMDAQWAPDGCGVSFVRGGDIWYYHFATQRELQLSMSAVNDRSAGIAEFIMQEEFDRFTGYWWRPVPDASIHGGLRYIAFLEVHEADVTEVRVGNYDSEGVRYPRAGQPNARSQLCLVSFSDSQVVERCYLHPALEERIPWAEYITRCGWTPDGTHVWVQVLDRSQQRAALAMYSIAEFLRADEISKARRSSRIRKRLNDNDGIIYSESTAQFWVNMSNAIHFLEDGHIIYATELFNGNRNLALLSPTPTSGFTVRQLTNITSGQIDSDSLFVDEVHCAVYFMGNCGGSPLEKHMYFLSYRAGAPTEPIQLTLSGGTHRCHMNSDCSMFVTTFSNLVQPSETSIFAIQWTDNKPVPEVRRVYATEKPDNTLIEAHLVVPSVFSFPLVTGEMLYGALYAPPNREPGRKYPLIIYCYGGPYVQLIRNDHKVTCQMRLQLLVKLGFCVGVVDGRGSARRGLAFEGIFRSGLGQFEVYDQVQGVSHMLRVFDFLDPARVGISGSSYGGYVALLALAHFPDVFRLAIAGAPVTKWDLYDSAYTERFLGTPEENPNLYARSSLIHLASQFPNESGRLLIVHGLNDENVHFEHTSCFIDALVSANKPYRLLIYPRERHGFRDRAALLHHETEFYMFLQDHL